MSRPPHSLIRLPLLACLAALSVTATGNTTDKLVNGTYTCYSGSNYLFMDIRIDGAEAYQDGKGSKGKYQLDSKTQEIRFLSGPYKEAKGKLLPGPRIGMNMTGGSFYSVTCSPKK